jgi:hypothetical protein
MLNICQICDKPLQEGDKVRVTVTSTYHMLKSTIAYALDKNDMTADQDSLRHEACDKEMAQ